MIVLVLEWHKFYKYYFTGASLIPAEKKPFPNSFLKNAIGMQDFSNDKDVGTSFGPAPQR